MAFFAKLAGFLSPARIRAVFQLAKILIALYPKMKEVWEIWHEQHPQKVERKMKLPNIVPDVIEAIDDAIHNKDTAKIEEFIEKNFPGRPAA